MVHAALISSKKSKETEKTYLLQKAMSNENVWETENKQSSIAVVPITAEAALAFLMENGLSKQQYINIKTLNKMHGCDIYPPYSELSELKLKCRPKEISYSETKVEVSLQNLLDHTVDRILSMQQEVLEIFVPTHCSLILSYGFDGSTGQSIYKQRFEQDNIDGIDQSLFVTTIIPLKLIDTRNQIIWMNNTPQSVRFCRPLKIQFIKETTDLILKEKYNLDIQIKNLKNYIYTNKQNNVIVEYKPYMTLIDGKVLNVLTKTNSCQSCPLCGAKPTQLLNTTDFNSSICRR